MITIPQSKHEKRDLESLLEFLKYCKSVAEKKGVAQIASIALKIDFMDPLAVLQSIYQAEKVHFYMENPMHEDAIVGYDIVAEGHFEGEKRFDEVKNFADSVLENVILIGDIEEGFSGPHFFVSFTFADHGKGVFPAARVFLPQWQVMRHQGLHMAVANFSIQANSDIETLALRILGVYGKFSSFDYGKIESGDSCNEILDSTEVGGKNHFEKIVREGLGTIEAGDLEKVVLARAVDLSGDEAFDALASVNRLREKFPFCYTLSTSDGKGNTFVACTPEKLVKVENNRVYTKALAGSNPRGKTAKEDANFAKELLNSGKNLHEHKLVLDYILNQLKNLGLEPEIIGDARIRQLPNIQHLETSVSAGLPEGMHLLKVAEVLHPTPAVAGIPKKASIDKIRDLEAFDRGLYGGCLGYFDHKGNGELVVGIRSALVNGDKARLYAGCGIVSGSDPQKEEAESNIKLKVMMNFLR